MLLQNGLRQYKYFMRLTEFELKHRFSKSTSRRGRKLATRLGEGPNDPNIFKAIFLAGGPGSGKTFVQKKLLSSTGLKPVNSDDMYEYLMKAQDLPLDPDTIASPQGQEIRDKAKGLTKRRQANYIDGRLGLIIDSTGRDVAQYERQSSSLKSLGYDTAMIFVNTSLEVALQRNAQRERNVPEFLVKELWEKAQQNLMKYQQIFGANKFFIVDNSGGLEDPTRAANFDKVFVELKKFVEQPPRSPAAKKWLDSFK